jgi:hypothetical protein
LLDDVEANVDNVDVIYPEACTAGIPSSGEEVESKGIEPVGGVPIGSHALPVRLTILGRRLTILVDKPEEEVNKDNIRLTQVPLLERKCTLGLTWPQGRH